MTNLINILNILNIRGRLLFPFFLGLSFGLSFDFNSSLAATKAEYIKLEETVRTEEFQKLRDSETIIMKLIQIDSHDQFAYYLLSLLNTKLSSDAFDYKGKDRLMNAVQFARQAIELDPHSELGYLAFSEALLSSGDLFGAFYILGLSEGLDVPSSGNVLEHSSTSNEGDVDDSKINNLFNISKMSWRKTITLAKFNNNKYHLLSLLKALDIALSQVDSNKKILAKQVALAIDAFVSSFDTDLQNITVNEKGESITPVSLTDAYEATKALSKKYELSDIKLALASITEKSGNYKKADSILEGILKKDPLHKRALLNHGTILSKHLKSPSRSVESFKKYISQFQNELDLADLVILKLHIGEELIKSKKFLEAEKYFNETIEMIDSVEGKHEILKYLSNCYKNNGEERGLVKYFIKLTANFGDEILYRDIGAFYSENNRDSNKAITAFENAAVLNPMDPSYHSSIAVLKLKLGDTNGAHESASKVLILDPNNTEAKSIINTTEKSMIKINTQAEENRVSP